MESAVVGLPDPEWGERVAAAVVSEEGSRLSPEEIQAHCRKHLHDWKCPKEVLFVDRLPRNPMGKVLTGEVARIFTARKQSPEN
jgi:acyl-CoA synthetase (AMP-forming)/AMP-acid ligase II